MTNLPSPGRTTAAQNPTVDQQRSTNAGPNNHAESMLNAADLRDLASQKRACVVFGGNW
nr:hypothetical protein [Fodinicola acaciae]